MPMDGHPALQRLLLLFIDTSKLQEGYEVEIFGLQQRLVAPLLVPQEKLTALPSVCADFGIRNCSWSDKRLRFSISRNIAATVHVPSQAPAAAAAAVANPRWVKRTI